jgi:hypothetical protein
VGSVLGQGGARIVHFKDANGINTTLSLAGPGSATLQFNGTGVTQTLSKQKVMTVTGSNLSLSSVAITGATAATNLNITGTGGSGSIAIGSITSDASLRSINATRAALSGNLSVTGTVGRVAMASATGGVMSVSGTSGTLTLAIGSITNETISSGETLSVQSTTLDPSSISAPSITRLAVKQDLNANITTGSIRQVTAGTISPGTWSITGAVTAITAGSISGLSLNAASIGRLNSRADITNSQVATSGNITVVAAASFSGTRVYAGNPTLAGTGLPAAFPTSASITTVTIGRGGFSNSIIGAASLGRVNLNAVTTQPSGTPLGVGAHQMQALTTTVDGKRLALSRVSSQSSVTAALTKAGITPNNLQIDIV